MLGLPIPDLTVGRNTASKCPTSRNAPVLLPTDSFPLKNSDLDTKNCANSKRNSALPGQASHMISPAQVQINHIDRAIFLLKKEHEAIMSNIRKQRQTSERYSFTASDLHPRETANLDCAANLSHHYRNCAPPHFSRLSVSPTLMQQPPNFDDLEFATMIRPPSAGPFIASRKRQIDEQADFTMSRPPSAGPFIASRKRQIDEQADDNISLLGRPEAKRRP